LTRRAYRKGHRYLTVVTDLDTGRVVRAAEGRSKSTVEAFFTDLGTERAAALTHVGCDGADWIHTVVTAQAPNALLCLDSFHVVAWAGEAVDEVRRRITRRRPGRGRQSTEGIAVRPAPRAAARTGTERRDAHGGAGLLQS
jgi:transposase